MLKSEYEKLLEDKPWQEMEDYFKAMSPCEIKPIAQLDIDTDEWIKFTIDNFEDVQQKYEIPKDHYGELANKWARINNDLGRNEHNTWELNYGMYGDSNEKLIQLLGEKNLETLNVIRDTILIRLIVKFPGHGLAWHQDEAGSYKKKMDLAFDENFVTEKGTLKRLWFSVQDWKDGHVMQISKTVLSDVKKGEVYQIPWNVGHASSNFGYQPQMTVSFTGVVK
tara:strand:- start:517 stop:1185 length:669 start_codon:yes stop_codon:yes gene_type:complete